MNQGDQREPEIPREHCSIGDSSAAHPAVDPRDLRRSGHDYLLTAADRWKHNDFIVVR